jgi:hypothetical protein
VIQDLDGGAPEPSRRGHVALLSAAVAAVSLFMLFALVAPPDLGPAPQAASPVPSSAGPAMTIVTGPTLFVPSDRGWIPYVPRIGLCTDPYIVIYDRMGQQVIGVFSMERSARSVPTLPDTDIARSPLVVSCATSYISAPLEGLSR